MFKHLKIAEYKIAKDEKELRKAVEYFAKREFSEGAMIKSSVLPYSISKTGGRGYIKFKNEFDIDAEVLGIYEVRRKEDNKLLGYNYWCIIRDEDGNPVPVGKTYNTKFKLKKGDIIRVAFVNLNRYTTKEGEVWFNWWSPRPIEPREDKDKPDTTDFANTQVEQSHGEIGEKEIPTDFKELLKIKEARPLRAKYSAILVVHFRGKSAHKDFRVKMNEHLEGWTFTDAPKGEITGDVNTLEDGKYWLKKVHWKFRPDMNPNEKVVAIPKAHQPLVWLTIREGELPPDIAYFYEIPIQEVVFPPGSIGATRFEEGVFITAATGFAYPGVRKPYFQEWFLDMGGYKGRMVIRAIKVGEEWEKPPKGPIQWQVWFNMKDQTPYVLSKRAQEKEFVPEEGESCLPPEWEEKIKPEFKWWLKNLDKSERKERIEKARGDLKEQKLIESLETPEWEVDIENPLQETVGKFILRRHFWKGQLVIRGMPIEHWDLVIDRGDDFLHEWYFERNPLFQEESFGLYSTCKEKTPEGKPNKAWLEFEGEIPPDHPEWGNPNKKIPAYMQILDPGKVNWIEDTELFKSFEFSGKQLKGYFIMKREDPKSDIWVLSKSAKPGEKRK